MISHIRLLQSSVSQLLEYNKLEVFLERCCIRSSLIECQSFLNRKSNINPEYRVLMPLPCTVHILRSTWYREVNLFRIFMPFVSGINIGKKNTVCLLLEF